MTGFNKVLVANRGAIATRIIRTLNRMAIDSVAVYAQSDRDSLHVQQASEAFLLGDGGPAETYLNIERLITIARQSQCEAIHPGYGFLSENTRFVERCESEGIAFIGPTSRHIALFGQKHIARELALAADVPLLPGSELLSSLDDAIRQAGDVGYPVMLKSTAGGGGIGMRLCADEIELCDAFDSVQRLGASNFANDAVFLEKAVSKARHIEVQVFGDGCGQVLSLGERDCSAQRRNQKVIEECPAPNLPDSVRTSLHDTAERLLASVNYRSAGTVEFIVDAESGDFHFLEVNTRLQVEHGVTEMVYDIDLVDWMVKLAANALPDLQQLKSSLQRHGHAVQARIYAEDPYRHFQPCAGPMTQVRFPSGDGIRVDHWVQPGIDIPSDFDPLLAKLISHASTRERALIKLQRALDEVQLYGSETNVQYLRALCADRTLVTGQMTTRFLDSFTFTPARMDVLRPGTMTTIQDSPGRVGYWNVGIPPSGPFDTRSFSLGNQLLGNSADCAGLEITLHGPALRFTAHTHLVVTGGDVELTIDSNSVTMWTVLAVEPGQTLSIGALQGHGARAYLCIAGGIRCPEYLGSKSTFTLGRFGGHNGAAIRTGDVLQLSTDREIDPALVGKSVPRNERPSLSHHWTLRVMHGPHSSPDFFTEDDIAMLFNTNWQVHYNSSRTGVRLIGPAPEWARSDGGEAGLHPSNIHDNAYAFGSIDFTGDMPVILGPDGPSLGGFVCPATVIQADLWKLGQLRAGDTLKFVADVGSTPASAVVRVRETGAIRTVYRAAGDCFLLVEYGEQSLSMESRFRAHALMQWLEKQAVPGVLEMTPGIRSLQIHFNRHRLERHDLISHLLRAEVELDAIVDTIAIPSRIVHLPLSWDDKVCQEAVEKYHQSVRKDAPWYPSNLEFIRRINGLESIDEVKRIVFDASYLVMGLGDVYLGAPVATPVNPAHRLVTTKYNPARTWTAENSVGIGGSYLCVYGMEGPGGYQFIGRTVQMWNRYKQTDAFTQPWLLRFFDQIRFFEVSHEELLQIRQDFPHGRYRLKMEHTEISQASLKQVVDNHRNEVEAFTQQRERAFARELAQWRATGQFNIDTSEPDVTEIDADWPAHCVVIESPVSGSLWQRCVDIGESVQSEQILLVLESMKMEISVTAPDNLKVHQILFDSGQRIRAGQPLIVLEAE